jgi:hypothetical protein
MCSSLFCYKYNLNVFFLMSALQKPVKKTTLNLKSFEKLLEHKILRIVYTFSKHFVWISSYSCVFFFL